MVLVIDEKLGCQLAVVQLETPRRARYDENLNVWPVHPKRRLHAPGYQPYKRCVIHAIMIAMDAPKRTERQRNVPNANVEDRSASPRPLRSPLAQLENKLHMPHPSPMASSPGSATTGSPTPPKMISKTISQGRTANHIRVASSCPCINTSTSRPRTPS